MRNKLLFYAILTIVVLAIIGTGCTMRPAINLANIEGKEVEFETISKYPYFGKDEGFEVVSKENYFIKQENQRNYYMITNEQEYLSFSHSLCRKDNVDFTRDMIIAVFSQGCSCCWIEVIKIVETENTLEIFVNERHVDGCLIFLMINISHVIKVKRTEKEISFNLKKEFIKIKTEWNSLFN